MIMDIKSIQNYYDTEKCSWREVGRYFNIDPNKLFRMAKSKILVSRSRSEAIKEASKKHPQKHTQATKDKISIARKKYLIANPDKIPYKLNHHSKGESYPEKYFKECFGGRFIEQYKVNLYSLDFADLEKQWDIEIDGSQHDVDQHIVRHDIKRNNFLINLGWNVIRISWKEFQKLNYNDKKLIIDTLLCGLIPDHKSIIFIKGNENISTEQFKLYIQHNNKKECPKCKGVKSKQSIICRKCSNKAKINAKMPEKSVLEDLIIKISKVSIGKKFNVTSTTVQNWLDYYNIPLPFESGGHVKYYWYASNYDKRIRKPKTIYYCNCGEVKNKDSKNCRKCYTLLYRKKLVDVAGVEPAS